MAAAARMHGSNRQPRAWMRLLHWYMLRECMGSCVQAAGTNAPGTAARTLERRQAEQGAWGQTQQCEKRRTVLLVHESWVSGTLCGTKATPLCQLGFTTAKFLNTPCEKLEPISTISASQLARWFGWRRNACTAQSSSMRKMLQQRMQRAERTSAGSCSRLRRGAAGSVASSRGTDVVLCHEAGEFTA